MSLKKFFYLLWGGVLVGPKGPGGTSIPNNYCNKCQGSNKKMGKSGPPYPACRCTSESTYTQIWHAYNTERFCPMCVEVYVQIEMYGGKKWILLAHDLTTSFYPSSGSAPLRSSWPWGREGRRDFYWSGGAVRHHLGERHFHLSRLRGRRAGGARHKQQRNIQPSQIERTRDNLLFFFIRNNLWQKKSAASFSMFFVCRKHKVIISGQKCKWYFIYWTLLNNLWTPFYIYINIYINF